MDKNLIKNHLTARFLNEESTPGIDVTKKAQKQSEKINKAAVKDIDKGLADYEKSIEKNTGKASKMPANKFNYNGDKEKEYHDQMEIMNGQEMVQYDRDPNQEFKDRAEEAIAGSSRMGNNPEWANVVVAGQGGDPTFGKNLVKAIKASTKKRTDADYRIMSFGDDIETVPKNSKKMSQFSALSEGEDKKNDMSQSDVSGDEYEKSSREIEYKNEGITEETEIEKGKFTKWCKSHGFEGGASISCAKEAMKDKYDAGTHKMATFYMNTVQPKGKTTKDLEENKNNNKPQIKQGMKRLNFKKEFNGVGNALKMIPESYKVDNKVFEMADGNESYKIRWEGTLSEGRAVILTASNKSMVNEDMQKMKHLMGYKSEKTLGLVKGNARLNENAIFNDIYTKTKALLEGEDIEDQDASEGDLNKAVSVAKEAKKDIQGSVSNDKGTQAPKPKTGDLDDVVSQAKEAKKHVEGSVESKTGLGLGVKAKEGNWNDISVPQAAEAKKHVTMSEGVTLGGVYYGPIVTKKKIKVVNESYYEEGYGDDNALNKLSPEDREEKLRTQPVYSEEENLDGNDLFRQFFITRFERQPEQDPSYFRTWVERLSKPNPEGYMDSKSKEVWDMVKGQDDDDLPFDIDKHYFG